MWLLIMVELWRWGCRGWRKGGFTSMGLDLLSWMWVWVCRGSGFASAGCFFFFFWVVLMVKKGGIVVVEQKE